jgi:hypothetical protein
MPSARKLLMVAENALRLGRTVQALEIFQEIAGRRPLTLECLAALSYLRTAPRRPLRRASQERPKPS